MIFLSFLLLYNVSFVVALYPAAIFQSAWHNYAQKLKMEIVRKR